MPELGKEAHECPHEEEDSGCSHSGSWRAEGQRENQQHVSGASGENRCLGQAIARMREPVPARVTELVDGVAHGSDFDPALTWMVIGIECPWNPALRLVQLLRQLAERRISGTQPVMEHDGDEIFIGRREKQRFFGTMERHPEVDIGVASRPVRVWTPLRPAVRPET